MSGNDADISENGNPSDGSVVSLPQLRGSLPQTVAESLPKGDLEIQFLPKAQDSSSSQGLTSSCHESLLSINEEKKETCEVVLNSDYVEAAAACCGHSSEASNVCTDTISQSDEHLLNTGRKEAMNFSAPLAHSSPKFNTPVGDSPGNGISPVTVPSTTSVYVTNLSGASSSTYVSVASSKSPSDSKVTGVASCFTDIISPSLYGSSPSSSATATLNLVDKLRPFMEHVNDNLIQANIAVNDGDEINNCKAGLSMKFGNIQTRENDASLKDYSELGNSQENYVHTSTETFKDKEERSLIANLKTETPVSENSRGKDNINNSTCLTIVGQERSQIQKEVSPLKWVEHELRSDTDEEIVVGDVGYRLSAEEIQNQEIINLEARCPLVLWHQDVKYIWIHIKLPAITKYNFTCDITSIEFSAVYNEITYRVSLKLYAGHKHEAVQCSPKAFHFEIRLKKLLRGKKYFWQRLTESEEKLHWLKVNVEKAFEDVEESEDEDVKRLACSMPLWNDNPTDTESLASDATEAANSELSVSLF